MNSFFEIRKAASKNFEVTLIELLREDPSIEDVCQHGTEHTHGQFMEAMRRIYTPASLKLRFAPDGIALKKDGTLFAFEAKTGKSIERYAYETYLEIAKTDMPVLIFCQYDGLIRVSNIEQLILISAEVTVARFPTQDRYPIVDGWIHPRAKFGFSSTPRMSGGMYREIWLAGMRIWAPGSPLFPNEKTTTTEPHES